MPTTASGTPYTVYTATVGGETCYWAVADARTTAVDIPTILYAHGAGGAANQFANLGAWKGLRDWLIDNGWAWIEGLGGGAQSWGNLAARAAYPAYLAHVRTVLDIGIVVLLGRSMGGLVTSYLYAHDTAGTYAGWINNSGVSTWFDGDDTNAGSSVPAISRSTRTYFTESVLSAAWGVANRSELSAALLAANAVPERWNANVWSGKKILNCYGDADTTVPWYPRGAATLRDIWAGKPAIDLVSVREGGDHTGGNGSYLDTVAMTSFLSELSGGPPAPPADPEFYRATGMFLWFNDERYLITP